MELGAFLQKQEEIYRKFDDGRRKAGQEGLLPDSFVAEEKGAFFYALRPGKAIRESLVPFLNTVRERSDHIVVYTEDILHTTITDYRMRHDFHPTLEERARVGGFLREVCDEAGSTEGIGCSYADLVTNQTTVILKGFPNDAFVAYAERVVKAAERRGVTLRMPWGAHITLARAAALTSPMQGEVIAALCENFSRLLPKAEIPYDGVMIGTLTARAGEVLINEF